MRLNSNITTGFYLDKYRTNKSFSSILNKMKIKEQIIEGNKYLHGFCDIFVMKLFELGEKHNLDYSIGVLMDDEEGLIHTFCCYETDSTYYIDVRGITDNISDFFEEFEDYFDYKEFFEGDDECYQDIYWFDSIEEYLNFMREEYQDANWYFSQEDLLKESENIINEYKEYYLISEHLEEE